MKKSLGLCIAYAWCSLAMRAPCLSKETLYLVRVFDENAQKDYLIMPLKNAPFGALKQAIKTKNDITIQNKIYFLDWSGVLPSAKTITLSDEAMDIPLEKALIKHNPAEREVSIFDKGGYDSFIKDKNYKILTKLRPSLINSVKESDDMGQSLFVQDHKGTFQLVNMDTYHKMRTEDPKDHPTDKPQEKEDTNKEKDTNVSSNENATAIPPLLTILFTILSTILFFPLSFIWPHANTQKGAKEKKTEKRKLNKSFLKCSISLS